MKGVADECHTAGYNAAVNLNHRYNQIHGHGNDKTLAPGCFSMIVMMVS